MLGLTAHGQGFALPDNTANLWITNYFVLILAHFRMWYHVVPCLQDAKEFNTEPKNIQFPTDNHEKVSLDVY